MKWTREALQAVQDQQEDWLLQQPGVCGVGITTEGSAPLSLQVLTNQMEDSVRRSIRDRLDDVPLVFTESGPIEALDV
jgi:hypothetical protein